MPTGQFTSFTNSLLTFQVSSGALVTDTNGNLRPGVATIQVEAQLDQSTRPQVERRPGVDTSAIYLQGPLTGVVGAEPGRELILPSVVTPSSPCSINWAGRLGRFHYEFIAPDSILQSLGIQELNEIQGWFIPSSFVISDEPWTPSPPQEGELIWAEIVEGQTLQANKAYWYSGLALGVMALPPSPELGDRLIIQRIGPANWRLTQRDGEQIQVFDLFTTLGEAGRLESVDQGSSVEISFNGEVWVAIASSGNLEVI